MAKEPVPGRVKTRLCPPCTPAQAAAVAEAALADTLEAAVDSGATDVMVALDGRPGPWLPEGVSVVPQCAGPFDHRLASAWADAMECFASPGIQIGMDTPQVTPRQLDSAMDRLDRHTDAVLGPATDGGWWILGLQRADERIFHGVPMSRDDTGAAQLARLQELGLRVRLLEEQTDVDHWADAVAVAAGVPGSRFAAVVEAVRAGGETTTASANR